MTGRWSMRRCVWMAYHMGARRLVGWQNMAASVAYAPMASILAMGRLYTSTNTPWSISHRQLKASEGTRRGAKQQDEMGVGVL